MSCFNFIIMKVNGADVSNLPYEEAVQLFLNAEEPILVEVRRRSFDDNNKLGSLNYDTRKSPTLAVIASGNTPNLYDGLEFCRMTSGAGDSRHTPDDKPAISSTSCQTELSAFSEVVTNDKEDIHMSLDGCLPKEFDIEEITLAKSHSSENLGFTVACSTDNQSGSDSGSEECIDRCRDTDEVDFDDVHKCKIYVRDIIPNSLADRDGRLRQGDRILQINGQNVLQKIDPDKLLTENKHSVTILVSRYAYTAEDDFLDSAVYCDDKECQDDRHLSSICECEQNTFSSKSSISQSEQKPPPSICPILPIAMDEISDLFNHVSIKAQLESVNKEISLLNSQISIMKQQQQQLQNQSQQKDGKQSPPPSVSTKEKQIKVATIKSIDVKPRAPNTGTRPDIDAEHIYETIPEDTDSDAYYCSPYDGVNELRVEEWLKSIGCTKSNHQHQHPLVQQQQQQIQAAQANNSEKHKADALAVLCSMSSRLQKANPILDDCDNSSSAYNTGGSCSSALLALDQQSKPTLVCRMDSSSNLSKLNPSKCRSIYNAPNEKKHIETPRGNSSRQLRSAQKFNYQHGFGENPHSMSCINRRDPVPSTPLTDADSDGHSTLVAKSSVHRMCQFKDREDFKNLQNPTELVWKVKRRPDGSRYIVRRLIQKSHRIDRSSVDSTTHPATQQDSTDFATSSKRDMPKAKDRRHRHKNPTVTPSKEKHNAQHWLV